MQVHKGGDWKNPSLNISYSKPCLNLTSHPIVAGPVSQSSRLSEYIDCIIKHFPQSTKSYVPDDIDFLSKLNISLQSEQQHRLITLDAERLYPNVNQILRINAMKYWIKKFRHKILLRFSEECICEAIDLVLKDNVFHFNDKLYIQTKGDKNGSIIILILYLTYLDDMLYETHKDEDPAYGSYIHRK